MAETGEYVYGARPTRLGVVTEGPTVAEADVLGRHVAYLRRLGKQGVVLPFGRTQENDERTLGLVIFRAESEAAARRIMREDPAIGDGVMRAELHPYRVAFLGRDR